MPEVASQRSNEAAALVRVYGIVRVGDGWRGYVAEIPEDVLQAEAVEILEPDNMEMMLAKMQLRMAKQGL